LSGSPFAFELCFKRAQKTVRELGDFYCERIKRVEVAIADVASATRHNRLHFELGAVENLGHGLGVEHGTYRPKSTAKPLKAYARRRDLLPGGYQVPQSQIPW
jgi:hypothetical protein